MRRVGGHVSIAGGISNAIQNTADIGGNCMQIFAGSPRLWYRQLWQDDVVNEFLSLISKHNLSPVFIHALYLVNLATDKSDLLQKSVDSLIMDLQNGALINSSGVIVHIGSHQGRGFDGAKNQIVSSIKKVLDATKTTKFLLENDAGQNGKIGSLEELSYLLSEIKSERLGICLDTAHLFASGYDLRDKQETKKLLQELKTHNLISQINLIHLNDSATDLGSGRDNHADLGKGKIGLDGLKNFVNQAELLHLPLILETPGPNKMGPDSNNVAIAKSF